MNQKIEFRIEGLNPDGEWVMVDKPLGIEGDHLAHRDEAIRVLRQFGLGRYSKVRLAKHVTTIDIIGEDITV